MAANNNQEGGVPDATIGTDVQIFPSDAHSAQASELSASVIPDQPETENAQDMTKTNGSTGIEQEQSVVSKTNESTGNEQTENVDPEGNVSKSAQESEGNETPTAVTEEQDQAAPEKTAEEHEASTASAGENEAPAKITDHPIVKEAQEIISNLKETQETVPDSNESKKMEETKEETKEVIPNDNFDNEEKYDSYESEDMSDEDDETDILSMLPKEVVKRVNKLKELNEARDKIIQDYLAERAELERYYLARCKPLYDRRRSIVKGELDDNIDSVPRGDIEESSTIKGVPQFWICAMGHLETIAEIVTEQDVDCLEALNDITCQDFPDGKGFTLYFYFDSNDYFVDKVLTKRYEVPNLLIDDEPILKSVTGCEIQWKKGKCLTHREVQKKQRSKSGKRAGQIRYITKREHTDSFFHFFNPPKMPSSKQLDADEADAIEEAFDHDYDVAQSFRSHLIPKGVLWFTGEALDDETLGIADDADLDN